MLGWASMREAQDRVADGPQACPMQDAAYGFKGASTHRKKTRTAEQITRRPGQP
jgi:hypothetical protein